MGPLQSHKFNATKSLKSKLQSFSSIAKGPTLTALEGIEFSTGNDESLPRLLFVVNGDKFYSIRKKNTFQRREKDRETVLTQEDLKQCITEAGQGIFDLLLHNR